jgi:hypothetical protein
VEEGLGGGKFGRSKITDDLDSSQSIPSVIILPRMSRK